MEPARGPQASVAVTGKAQGAGPQVAKLYTVAAANKAAKHVGAEGSEYVAETLRNVKPPQAALQEVQKNCGLSNPMCMPLLTMLDYLGVKRREAHLHLLNRSKDMLLKHIADMKTKADSMAAERVGHGPDAPETPEELKIQEKFERLLIASFKYMGVAELKQVPIDVMASMTRVPAAYLKQLAEEREIFNELPPAVKQQVYEYDRSLLQQDAVQYIAAYKYETSTITTAISMHHYVRRRQALLRKPPRTAGAAAAGSSGGAGRLPPKLGLGGGGGSAGGLGTAGQRRGFSVVNVLKSLDASKQEQQQQQQQQHQRRTPPRSPAAGEPKPLGMISQGGSSGSGGGKHPQNTAPSRSFLRKQSHVVRALVAIVGTSGKIYQHLIDLCKVRLAETESAYLGIKETSYCQLRTQVLMYLHDTEKTAVSSNKMGGGSGLPRTHKEAATTKAPEQLCDEEPIYKLAWNLDAAITQRKLTVKHMRQLAEALKQHLEPPQRWIDEDADIVSSAAAAGAAGARKPTGSKLPKGGRQQAAVAKNLGVSGAGVGSKRQRGGQGSNPGGGKGKGSSYAGYSEEVFEEDEGQWEEDGWIIKDEAQKPKRLKQQQRQQPASDQGDELDAADVRGNQGQQKKWLGDAAMILRDPPALHLLAAEFVELLYRCLALRVLPADEPQLAWLLQLMELAVSARSCLRERNFSMPPVAPIKVKHVAEVQTRGGAQVAVELSPEEVVVAWSRGKGASSSEPQQQQRQQQHLEQGGSSASEDDSFGGLLPLGEGKGKGYDWHTRKRGGKEYEVWFSDHDQLTEVWPEVMAVLAEGEMLAQPWQQDPADADVAPLSPGWRVVVGAYAGHEAVRQVIQMLVLDRIVGNDLVTAYRLLRVIVASTHLTTPGADREYAPFGFAMAGMLEELVRDGRLSATSKFWKLAFEGVLLRVVDAEQSRNQARVHKAMLDLLKSAAKQLSSKVLAGYLGTMLEATQDTRTRLQDRQEEFNRMQVHQGGGIDTIPGYVNFSNTHHDWSDGFRLVRKEKYGSSDGLSSDYKALLAVGGLHGNEHLWPHILKEYMQAAAGRQQAEDASRRAEREEQQQAALAAAAYDDSWEDAPYDPTAD